MNHRSLVMVSMIGCLFAGLSGAAENNKTLEDILSAGRRPLIALGLASITYLSPKLGGALLFPACYYWQEELKKPSLQDLTRVGVNGAAAALGVPDTSEAVASSQSEEVVQEGFRHSYYQDRGWSKEGADRLARLSALNEKMMMSQKNLKHARKLTSAASIFFAGYIVRPWFSGYTSVPVAAQN